MNEYERMRMQMRRLSGNDTPHSAIVRCNEDKELSEFERYIMERERLRYIYLDEPIVETEQIDIEGIIERLLLKSGFVKK